MKRGCLIFIAVSCVLFLFAGCQQQARVADKPAAAEAVEKKGEPKIEFESLVCDFGKVGPGQKLHGEFKFTNAGDAPLKITKVEKCCGAVTKLDKEELAPGESGVLKVQYTSSRLPNKIKKFLYVNSNDKDMPRATLNIKAETVLKVHWEPRSLRLLLKDENAGCPPITLTSTDNQPFSITGFDVTGGSLTAEFDSSVQATKFILQPKVDMEKLQKRPSGRINIGLAYPEPNTPPDTARVIFRVLSRFSVSPSVIMFFYDNPEQPIKKYLTITNNYREAFEIESTSSKEGRIKVLSQKKLGNRYQLELEITPKPGDDTKKITDTFTINLKDDRTLEVTCRGTYKPAKVAQESAPEASVTKGKTAPAATEFDGPATKITFESVVCDFGKVGPGVKSVGQFKFTNTGDNLLKITKVERCCGVVTTLDKTEYEPGESGVLEVRYTSNRTPGKIKKLLYVNSNDEDNPRITLTVQARVDLQVTWEPKSLKLLLKDENAGCPPITLRSTKNQPFSITKFESTGGFLNADIDNSIEATEFVLQPKVDMAKLKKSQAGRIRIGLAYSEPNIPPESVSIVFRALARFSTMPSMVRISYDEPDKPINKDLWIIGNYGEDFEVESTSSKEGHIKVLSQKKNRNGNSYVLSLEIAPPEGETLRFKDVLYVNLKAAGSDKTLEVLCEGINSGMNPKLK